MALTKLSRPHVVMKSMTGDPEDPILWKDGLQNDDIDGDSNAHFYIAVKKFLKGR